MRLEQENYAKKGVAGTALGLSIGAVAVEALKGGLGNIFTGVGGCGDNHGVSQREAALSAQIAALETEVKLRDANTYTDQKILDLYRYIDGRIDGVNAAINAQAVYNATTSSVIGCLTNQVNQLMGLTKVVIPSANICPAPMPMYNSWTAPTTGTTGNAA